MTKFFLLLFSMSLFCSTIYCDQTTDTTIHTISFSLGIDITDDFTGINKTLKSRDFASCYLFNYTLAKKWYGSTFFIGYYGNRNYLVPKSDLYHTFYVPENVTGFLFGTNVFIAPVSNKFFSLQLETGLHYSYIVYKYCYTWNYTIENQTPTLQWTKYKLTTYKGFSFLFGVNTNFRIYNGFSLLLFGRATSSLNDDYISMILAGAGIAFTF